MMNQAVGAAIAFACTASHPPAARLVTAQQPCPDSGKGSPRDSVDLTHDIRRGPRIRLDSSGALHPVPPVPVRGDTIPCPTADTVHGQDAPS